MVCLETFNHAYILHQTLSFKDKNSGFHDIGPLKVTTELNEPKWAMLAVLKLENPEKKHPNRPSAGVGKMQLQCHMQLFYCPLYIFIYFSTLPHN